MLDPYIAGGFQIGNIMITHENGTTYDVGYDQIVLRREGFQSLTIRNKHGYWQVLEYIDRYGSERWSKPIDETIFDVEAHIKLYAN